MSNKSSDMKKKGGNVVTKKMISGKMEEVAQLAVALEAVSMEWEVWFRLIKMQKLSLDKGEITLEAFMFFINDGPPFTDLSGKIMESIRKSIPDFTKEKQEQDAKPVKPTIFGADGFAANTELPKVLDSTGKQVVK